jgi:hypothetical protein
MAQKKSGIGQKEEPLKHDDHCPDCIRYLCMQLDYDNIGFIEVLSHNVF